LVGLCRGPASEWALDRNPVAQTELMRIWSRTTEGPAFGRRRLLIAVRSIGAVLTAAALAMGGYTAGASRSTPDLPKVSPVDAGFLRDMVVHHSQAVTLAMIIVGRATLPTVRELAGEIAKTQATPTRSTGSTPGSMRVGRGSSTGSHGYERARGTFCRKRHSEHVADRADGGKLEPRSPLPPVIY
jgi:hypothetical protein